MWRGELVDQAKGCIFRHMWRKTQRHMALQQEMEAYRDPSLEESLWRWCPAVGVLTWSLHAGDPASLLGPLSLRRSADITAGLPIPTVITNLQGNEVTTVTGITSEKFSMRQQGLKTITDEGWIRNSGKLCISLQSYYNIQIKRINLVGGAMCCSRWAEGGLGSVKYSESFNRLILASLFNTLSSVPVG